MYIHKIKRYDEYQYRHPRTLREAFGDGQNDWMEGPGPQRRCHQFGRTMPLVGLSAVILLVVINIIYYVFR